MKINYNLLFLNNGKSQTRVCPALYVTDFFFVGLRPNAGHGLLILEVF